MMQQHISLHYHCIAENACIVPMLDVAVVLALLNFAAINMIQ